MLQTSLCKVDETVNWLNIFRNLVVGETLVINYNTICTITNELKDLFSFEE